MRKRSMTIWAGILAFLTADPFGALATPRRTERQSPQDIRVHLAQGARTCRDVSSCREAVILWCGGYRRADADHDGIPCENVCRSLAQVEAIKEEIDC